MGDSDEFDTDAGVNHELTLVRDEDGEEAAFDLWTTVFTPRELRLLSVAAGAEVEAVVGLAGSTGGCRRIWSTRSS